MSDFVKKVKVVSRAQKEQTMEDMFYSILYSSLLESLSKTTSEFEERRKTLTEEEIEITYEIAKRVKIWVESGWRNEESEEVSKFLEISNNRINKSKLYEFVKMVIEDKKDNFKKQSNNTWKLSPLKIVDRIKQENELRNNGCKIKE